MPTGAHGAPPALLWWALLGHLAVRTQGSATQLVPPGWASSSLTLLLCGFCRVLGAALLSRRLCLFFCGPLLALGLFALFLSCGPRLARYQMLSVISSAICCTAPILMSVYVILYALLTPSTASTAVALFNILRFPMTMFWTTVTPAVEANVAIRRLQYPRSKDCGATRGCFERSHGAHGFFLRVTHHTHHHNNTRRRRQRETEKEKTRRDRQRRQDERQEKMKDNDNSTCGAELSF